MDKEHVRYPDFFHQPPVKGHALVGGAGEGQPLILPVVPQIQGHGEVLGVGVGVVTETLSGLSLSRRTLLTYYIPHSSGISAAGLYGLFMTKH